jgi:catechol-2,3-dioxygenase
MIPVQRLNHAVLYVRDPERTAAFYREAFGFEEIAAFGDGAAIFLRAPASTQHHDLGLFRVGADAPLPERGRVGLYHLAWEVPTIEDLVAARDSLSRLGALVGASDHGTSKSLYARDPDGLEFEVMWAVPREHWGALEHDAVIEPLDLPREVARFGTTADR